jgi:hypothetical protein
MTLPNWNEVLEEINYYGNSLDYVRRKYLKKLSEVTGRNVIAYYSGWLQKPNMQRAAINDDDKNGFMTVIHGLDRQKGLDLLIHTPGGEIAAVETLGDYLRKMFGLNIRAIIPQLAMSAGTTLACCCKEIIMGKQSSIGPIDPQFNGIPAFGVLEEFKRAIEETKKDPQTIPIWQAIVSKYHPTFIIECEKSIKWSKKIASEWLSTGMFKDEPNSLTKTCEIVDKLTNYTDTLNHSRHISMEEAISMGLKIIPLETYMKEDNFQDIVLTIHHAYMHTFSHSPTAIKIAENHLGQAMVQNVPLHN